MNIIIHPDELFLKGANQRYFYSILIKNLKALFKGVKVERVESGLLLSGVKAGFSESLQRTPGISNFAVAERCGSEMDEIEKAVDVIASEALQSRGVKAASNQRDCNASLAMTSTFRITATRSNKKYPLNSKEIAIQLGDYVRKKYNLKVDLKNYDLNIHINILKDSALVYINPIEGAGGLPTGSSGKVLCLLSGGIDSPVAAYKMMRRGAEIGLIHFQNETEATEEVGQKIFDLAKVLSQHQPKIKLFIVPFDSLQREVVMKIPADYRMIIIRRLFFRIAESVAQKNKYKALVTGDSLGQVASQTIENLTSVYTVINESIRFAPLIGDNKKEIINIARNIGTLEISNRPYEDCCSLFVAKHPQTRSKLEDVVKLESSLDLSILDKLEIKSYNIGMD